MAVRAPHRLTAEEFFALPGELKHTELIDGEIVVDTPSMRHQDILASLLFELMLFSRAHPEVGKAGIELSTPINHDSVFAPDLWWTTPDHTPAADQNRHAGPPDLVIEIRSPSTWSKDRGRKKDGYEAIGVPELWLVDTEHDTILVFRRSAPGAAHFDVSLSFAEGDTLTTPVLPGFELDVGAVFDQ